MNKEVELHRRDFAADMRKFVDKLRSGNGSYNAGVLAHDVVQRLLSEDRELLYGFLEAHATHTIRTMITAADAATRSYARHNAPASVFAEAAKEAEGGNKEPLKTGFLQAVYVINAQYDRKALKDMTAEDVLYVASSHESRAKSALLEAAFMRAIARRIGKGRVADAFNNVQLAELRARLTGKDL
jgi:hypothetical protein